MTIVYLCKINIMSILSVDSCVIQHVSSDKPNIYQLFALYCLKIEFNL